jgi:alkanesulfonate monooxygenase SsuD/methylene tetrahydromethanopterin reductase-like flavin-dependent oxidoreductase (luciferase family)
VPAVALSVGVQTWGTEWPALRQYWRAAETLGYDRVTYGDGLFPWTHAGWVALGALAVTTRRVRVGPAVTYCFDAAAHHPSWLAKAAVAVDHLSGGRLDLRLGVGAEDPDAAGQWAAHGIRYPEAAERVRILDEALQVLPALWSGEPVEFQGRAFTLKGATLLPRPLQSPRPPLWVAAMGAGALGAAAARGDGWEASYLTPEEFQERWARVRTLLERAGRDADAFRRSVEADVVLGRDRAEADRWRERYCREREVEPRDRLLATALAGDPEEVRAQVARYRAAGATDLMLSFADFPRTGMLRRFARTVLPALREGADG